jgi:hypothetical protein
LQSKEQARAQTSRAEQAWAEVRRREEAAALHQAQLEGLQKSVAEVRGLLEEEQERVVKEKSKRQKAEDEGKVGGGAEAWWEGRGERKARRNKLSPPLCSPGTLNIRTRARTGVFTPSHSFPHLPTLVPSQLLSSKLERLRKLSNTGSAAKELQEEMDAMRQLINCSVCHERQKNTILTKCCHVFCDKCIKRNLENRNRKCPGCGVPFGLADVKQIYFT